MMVFMITKIASLTMLAALLYISLKYIFMSMDSKSNLRSRLSKGWRRTSMVRWKKRFIHRIRLLQHVSDLLESISSKLSVGQFVGMSIVLAIGGVLVGSLFFTSLKGICSLACILALIPYISLRMRLLTMQMRSRINLLPAMEIFYQSYTISEHKNIRTVLKSSIEENRMLYPMKAVFEQLYLGLMVNKGTEASLRIFALTLGNHWADHFCSILRLGLTEGIDLSLNLNELINDMRKAQRTDQAERNRLLEIRIANFSPLLFLVVFLMINFRMDADQAYAYYVVSKVGRDMLLDTIILIGASFLMGIYLSLRRM